MISVDKDATWKATAKYITPVMSGPSTINGTLIAKVTKPKDSYQVPAFMSFELGKDRVIWKGKR